MPENFAPKNNTHKKYLDILSVLSSMDGLHLYSNKMEVIDYLENLIRANMPKIRMEEAKILKRVFDTKEIAYKLGSYLNFAINNHIPLTRVADQLGTSVLLRVESKKTSKRDRSIARVKSGIELLDLLRQEKKIVFKRESIRDLAKNEDEDKKSKKRSNSRDPYRIKVLDEGFATKLALAFYYPSKDIPLYTQPFLSIPDKWTEFRHEDMGDMVRNVVEGTERKFSLNKTPVVFRFMNKIRKVGFRVNKELLEIFTKCQDDSIFTHEEKDYKGVQLESILRQQNEIFRIAHSLKDFKFF